ncbi:MAG TPA: hypothetical protein VFW87_04085 [Pirellulales bacterium]|nr:hypothetical protein [Pirellulales bacterium]
MPKNTARQNQKQQLRRKKRLQQNPALLAYHGHKYQTEALTMPLMHAEMGILEADVASQRRLTDREVQQKLAQLIEMLRHGPLEHRNFDEPVGVTQGQEADLIVRFITTNWQHRFADDANVGRDNQIGILRTILASIEKHRSSNGRGYLNFLDGFLRKAGVRISTTEGQPPSLPR